MPSPLCRGSAGRGKHPLHIGCVVEQGDIVGEGPGADEDAQGIPFVGRAGELDLRGRVLERDVLGGIPEVRPMVEELHGKLEVLRTRLLQAEAAGELDALFLFGADVLRDFPDRDLAERALESDTYIVVVELFATETVAYADVVLPSAAYAELDPVLDSQRIEPVLANGFQVAHRWNSPWYEMLDDTTGYIRLTEFGENSGASSDLSAISASNFPSSCSASVVWLLPRNAVPRA